MCLYTVPVAKKDSKDKRRNPAGVQTISTVDNPDSSGPGLFVAALALILVAGMAGTAFFVLNRESNIGVAPEANIDHWHSAYLIHDCGADLPVTNEFEAPAGVHTHGDGLLHVHPYNPNVAGRNATIGAYFEAYGAEITDESFTPGFADLVREPMTEENGCNGEEATLQLAVWRNAFDDTAEPEIITENIADFQFETAGMAVTLALLPEGEEVPRPPADRVAALTTTGPGGPIFGVEEGQSPFITVPTPESEETTEDGAAGEEVDGDDADAGESTEDTEPTEDTEDADS